jgi:multicomponent K+:H+ antiporter subunit C
MEILFSSAIGLLAAAGVFLVLRRQTFPVILGLAFLTYAVNLFLFGSGRLLRNQPPLLDEVAQQADPLPQALVLTAIVISFGMTAVIVMLALGAWASGKDDGIDVAPDDGAAPDPSARDSQGGAT